jgi:hypothetical protein
MAITRIDQIAGPVTLVVPRIPDSFKGPKGDTGPGVAAGGASNELLIKQSAADFDTGWSSASSLGIMRGVNNLSDVADVSTARTTLGAAGIAVSENITGIWAGANAKSFTELKNRSITGLTDGSAILLTDANGWRSGAFTWRAGNQSSRITDNPIAIDYASAASSNQIRNPRGARNVGFTSSTVPTNWAAGALGGYSSASYARARRNGIPGIDVTFNGTANGTAVQINFESSQQVDALAGETWTGSLYFATVGTFPAPSASLRIFERNSGGGFVNNSDAPLTTGGTVNRTNVTRLFTGDPMNPMNLTAYANLSFVCTPTNGSAGFTVFLACPSLDESATARPIALPAWGGSLVASSATKLIERPNHGLLHGEKVRLSGVDYWVERLNGFQYRLHNTLESVYNDAASLTPPSVEAASPSTSVARLKDPGEMRIVAPASDATGASGVWERNGTASTPFIDNVGQVSLQKRTASGFGVNFLWGLTADTDAARAEAVQNAVNTALEEPVLVPPGNWALGSGTIIQKNRVVLVGSGRNVSTLNYSSSLLSGLVFRHPDAGESSSFDWLSNIGVLDLTIWGNNAIDGITYDQAAGNSTRFSVTSDPFRGVLMRGAQGHILDTFSVVTFCETPNSACVRAEERPLFGGEQHMPFFPSEINNSTLIGQTTSPLSAVITGITLANPAVITTNIAHGLLNGQEVWLPDVTGMTQVTGRVYRVANVTSTTFELVDPYSPVSAPVLIDSTGFDAFTGGGRLVRVQRCDYLFSCNRSDGINMSGTYWGSCRRAFIHLDPAREGGGQTPGVYLVQVSNFYFDGIDNAGATPRSPRHILHLQNTGGSDVKTSDIRFSNGTFANNRSPGTGPLVKADPNSIESISFSNVSFATANEELIYGQGGVWLFDDACTFLNGGVGVAGANQKPMLRWDGASAIHLNGSVGTSAGTQPRVLLTGTIGRLQSSASFSGTNVDFDVSGATIGQSVVIGPSGATVPYRSLNINPFFTGGTLTPTLGVATPGATPPSYTAQSGSWVRIGNFVTGHARLELSNKGDGSGAIEVILDTAGIPTNAGATNVAASILVSPVSSGVLDKAIGAFVVGGGGRIVRIVRGSSDGTTFNQLTMADITNTTRIDVSFTYRIA